jgi:hypothetical protein
MPVMNHVKTRYADIRPVKCGFVLYAVLNCCVELHSSTVQVMKHIHYEDENTRYVDIGPVNKVINMLCCWFEDPHSTAFKK